MDLAWISRRAMKPEGIETIALLEKVEELSKMTDEIIGQVRRISSELRPGVLDDLGLVPAIVWKAQDFAKRTEIKCKVRADIGDVKPSRAVCTTAYRVLEEALTNVARHAEAKRVDVELDVEDGHLVLGIRDDGKGIAKESLSDKKSLGILGIRERARRHGGSATLTPGTPHGTELVLRLPVT
jgi:signal transduction histidine kinase